MATITTLQMKLGRTALGMSIRDLAEAAGVAPSTIVRFETGKGGMHATTIDRIQTLLEERGVIFIPADAEGGASVRLKKK